ncbi:hypothetical protein [Streptomyces sp. BE133]|uniref:hypothetical protein n=1 Tax=Streptomyces sp. BE133 TaxID=3002523 RepID=UPI002E7759CB|nr:hypothetical protein [Streptomyces sp. BE133]MEE1807628.1 hypothetical protein [Streptomyces sp. BE133]
MTALTQGCPPVVASAACLQLPAERGQFSGPSGRRVEVAAELVVDAGSSRGRGLGTGPQKSNVVAERGLTPVLHKLTPNMARQGERLTGAPCLRLGRPDHLPPAH